MRPTRPTSTSTVRPAFRRDTTGRLRRPLSVAAVVTLLAVPAAGVAAGGAAAADPATTASGEGDTAKITVTHWDDLRDWNRGTFDNVWPDGSGALTIDSNRAGARVTYTDPFGDGTARRYVTGSWTSPVVTPGYAVDESISSWNARTPTGTFVETTFRGRLADGTWTKWYVMGRWTSGDDYAEGDIHRTSVDGQGDENANIWTDTFSARTGHEPVAYQTRVTLLKPEGTNASPKLDGISTMTNELLGEYPGTSTFTLGRATELPVPRFSQNIHRGEYPQYGGGGEVWCSPTSTSMVQYFWGRQHRVPPRELADVVSPNGDPQVPYAAINTWDYTYEGSGNWPFNAAYAHRFGLDAQVTRLRSLAEAERFVSAGIPLVFSASWDLDEMPEAGYDTNGHLLVLVGFTADGDPVINDPASPSDAAVRHVYTRANFEKVWQEATGGVTYVIHPSDVPLPTHPAGLTPNW
ncbi:C39 family peptidase [Terracoccus luteus]|jgi:hypothetical protein|uniref:Peptidase C39-like domain-containing protein n=1 Tax=Terracoccus luteus TaxID=53356 RepID=A0A839PWE3_9MICO|nr:C39 family peptidase [Terracoccus luteus]MBB2987393.1 hypothetical protein [Terracoccus luteus]MCP2173044.1 hypothetical protein [Terracoccus luteus]